MITIKNYLVFALKSKIKLIIKGNNIERFIKRLKSNDVDILSMKRVSRNEISIKVYKYDYDKIIKLKTIYNINIVSYYGLEKYKRNILNNKYVIISIIICFVGLYILSNIIFHIDIVTNDSKMKSKLSKSLKAYGIEKYKFKKSYNTLQLIKKEILSEYKNDLEWLEIEVIGTKYIVRYEPRVINEKEEINEYRNIIASKDAVIKSINVSGGQVIKKINSYVKKGEVIVSGYIYLNENIKDTVSSKGKIYGETWYIVTINYPYKYSEEILTGNSKNIFTIKFLNKYIEIFNFNKYKDFRRSDKTIIKNNLLPIKFIKERQLETKKTVENNNYEELIKKAVDYSNKKIKSTLQDGEYILDYKVLNTRKMEEYVELDIFYSVVEDITEYQMIDKYELEKN